MGKLVYSLTASLDGFIADNNGKLEWADPSEEQLVFIDDNLRNVGTFLLGRHMYETLAVWDTIPTDSPNEGMNRFAEIWRAADKIVYSSTLSQVTTQRTELRNRLSLEDIRQLKSQSTKDLDIGGPLLAAEAIKAGLVDEYHHFIAPVIIGDGRRWLPENVRLSLKLVDERRFDNGIAYLKYLPVQD